MSDEAYWIVLRDPTIPNATARHATREAAQAEAERLAMKYGAPFHAYRVTLEGTAQPQRPLWVAG